MGIRSWLFPEKPYLQVHTRSGAIYWVYKSGRVTGGSKGLSNGRLLATPEYGFSMYVYAKERQYLNPSFSMPAVQSTPVVSIIKLR